MPSALGHGHSALAVPCVYMLCLQAASADCAAGSAHGFTSSWLPHAWARQHPVSAPAPTAAFHTQLRINACSQVAAVQSSAVEWVAQKAVSTGTAAAAMPERIAHIDAAMEGLQDGTFQPRVRVMQSERFSRRAGILQVLTMCCAAGSVGAEFN